MRRKAANSSSWSAARVSRQRVRPGGIRGCGHGLPKRRKLDRYVKPNAEAQSLNCLKKPFACVGRNDYRRDEVPELNASAEPSAAATSPHGESRGRGFAARTPGGTSGTTLACASARLPSNAFLEGSRDYVARPRRCGSRPAAEVDVVGVVGTPPCSVQPMASRLAHADEPFARSTAETATRTVS